MKEHTRLLIAYIVWFFSATLIWCQSHNPATGGLLVLSPKEIFSNPLSLEQVWVDKPIDTIYYTAEQKARQRAINEYSDEIITYRTEANANNRMDIDFEEITPYTWKWIDLEFKKEDGTPIRISLRRPNWWILKAGADQIGNNMFLDMPEMGITGYAAVKAVRINQLDTRFWKDSDTGVYRTRPITGKFEHERDEVYVLEFEGSGDTLGVTGSHPIWSEDQSDWISSRDLRIGESVRTMKGSSRLKSRRLLEGKQKVFNIEVYQDHNYQVTSEGILVHNGCWPVEENPSLETLARGGCEEVAIAIQQTIGGEIMEIARPERTPRGDLYYLGPVKSRKGMIETWQMHRAVYLNGKVYDQLVGEKGMLLEDYKKLFYQNGDGIDFKIMPKE